MEQTIIIVFLIGFTLTIIIVGGNAKREENNELNELLDNTSLISLDNKTSLLIYELSKWINNCKRCSNNQFYISDGNIQQLKIVCNSCNSYTTLKANNTFYSIEVIETLVNHFNEIVELIQKYELDKKVASYKIDGYSEKAFEIYSSLENEYFVFKRLKKQINYGPSISMLIINSEGSKIDEAKRKLETKKIGKLKTKRDALPESVINEWNYKKITTGKKGLIIKNWAKKSNLKCIDGSKCGGIKFKEIENSKITFGHIIPQSWSKEYPHLLTSIHHPDNLYLTCQSCNSSLSSGFPDDELKKRISGKEGTIGDWLRNHIEELKNEV